MEKHQHLYIGSDHAGYDLKEFLKRNVQGVDWTDVGTNSEDSVDYPDFAHQVALNVAGDPEALGILICGSGNGVAIAANRHRGVRAALAWQKELARLGVEHNNANVLVLPARFISNAQASEIVTTFLESSFQGGRHLRRVAKIEPAK